MAEIPLLWRSYAAHQSTLDNRTFVDATSWGMEEALNYLLQAENPCANTIDINRIIASAARRNRYARSLLAKHIIIRSEVHDATGQIEARSCLAVLQSLMPADKLNLLVELAVGAEQARVAAKYRITIGTLRTRVARARQSARGMAA